MGFRILAVNRDTKTSKGVAFGALTGVQFLAPATLSGVNLCAWSTAACRSLCLFEAGRGSMHVVRDGRLRKSHLMLHQWNTYVGYLEDDLHKLSAQGDRLGLEVGVRLDGTSDLRWDRRLRSTPCAMERWGKINWYDYTKDYEKAKAAAGHGNGAIGFPSNYSIVYSYSGSNWKQCRQILKWGRPVAVIFRSGLPDQWRGVKVIDGDRHDIRWREMEPVIIGLSPKGHKARQDRSGMVVDA
jgi:hypothetical protein